MAPARRTVERTIFALLKGRQPGATICPSDAARALSADDWRPLMPLVREVARSLEAAGRLEWRQRRGRVDPATVRGAVRLALPEPG